MRYFLSLITILLIINISPYAIAGGSDGSDVLGPIQPDNSAAKGGESSNGDDSSNGDKSSSGNKSTIMDKVKDFLKNKNVGDDSNGLLMNCLATPQIEQDQVPMDEFNKNGNLIRKAGAANRARGDYIVLKGRVVDEDCLPISDAVIQIWQTDNAGNYLESYKLKSEWDVLSPDYDKNFAYSGTAQTDNLGQYNFLTILPVSNKDDAAPHINMIVKQPDFAPLGTMVYFNKHPRNRKDKAFEKLSPNDQKLVVARGKPIDPTGTLEGREYDFIITLKGINKFRKY